RKPQPFASSIPLRELIPLLRPQETAFIDALDKELEKIEKFYDARKSEMEARTKVIEAQLIELNIHHQRFNEARAKNSGNLWSSALHFTTRLVAQSSDADGEPETPRIKTPETEETAHGQPSPISLDKRRSTSTREELDPEEYVNAKKKLQKAVIEHYRALEMLQNYRILNVTGFRKALKKFEKITRIPLQQAYMTERVEPSSFASDKSLRSMMDEMEALYTSHFAHGDKKRAKTRLRAGAVNKTHHYSTFRSGLLLGLAVPALISGLLLVPGTRRVEFTDFWMGDQFCSLIFTLGDLWVFACSYARGFNDWHKCGSTSKAWPVAFSLAILPLLIRVIQSIKRYTDSRLSTHLINAGKYFAGIVYYLTYYIWRHQGSLRNTSFVIWCIFGTVYALYASAWDFLMDWSIFKPHVKYPFLREELLYADYIPVYYFAIISNVLIRFIWVLYIPSKPDMYVQLFIVGFMEMLRRWQWNFFRLENEHLGNMDQYRVTREVPLPYSFDGEESRSGDTDDD
ncbi:hypothetical protein GYMLUDRAFT_174084, partial [Collybiopsis luxurians FD-317 M1]